MSATESDVLLDSLPYIDSYTPQLRSAADKLVAAEMNRMKPKDYLTHLPEPEMKFANATFLQAEYNRITNNEPQVRIDMTRYLVEAPPETETSLEAWQQAVDNAYTALETQISRAINLELMAKYGPTTWRIHADHLAAMVHSTKEKSVALQKERTALHRKRKASQFGAKSQLDNLQQEYYHLVGKNHEIEVACVGLEREVKRLKSRAAQRGLSLEEEKSASTSTAMEDEE